LPKKTKRLVFLSSLIGYITKNEEPDKELLQKINNLLALSENDRAMVLPMYISKTIWHDRIQSFDCFSCVNSKTCEKTVKNMCLSHQQICRMSNAIITNIPNWMVYGTKRHIRHDVMTLLANLPNLQNYHSNA
jgi:hypothetical protein